MVPGFRSQLLLLAAMLVFAGGMANASDLPVAINDGTGQPQSYTLLAPLHLTSTYLIDMKGNIVKTWESDCPPACSVYLLENGNLLRTGVLPPNEPRFAGGTGVGGRVQEIAWDGTVVWDFQLANDKQLPHHDVCKLPNGNVLMIAWDRRTIKEAVAAGRLQTASDESNFLCDSILEVKPTGKTTGEIVWEWHIWDHLIQDTDPAKPNYGDVAARAERIDVNYSKNALAGALTQKDTADKLRSLGYLNSSVSSTRRDVDWTHTNSVTYNAEFDQIMISVLGFNEIWVIDHSTTKAEAAGSKGGRYGKGGDLLYRWGNPQAYRMGTAADQKLFGQHNATWIPKGIPGAGNVLIFNNGVGRPVGSFSSVDEIVIPVDAKGIYAREPGKPFGPEQLQWTYSTTNKSEFYSMVVSGAQRLANGNTLICDGMNGRMFEVTPQKERIWGYRLPNSISAAAAGSNLARVQILPVMFHRMLQITPDQAKKIQTLQNSINQKFDQLLTAEQKKQFDELQGSSDGGMSPTAQTGEIIPAFQRVRLKLSEDQKSKVDALQSEIARELDSILTSTQSKQLKNLRSRMQMGGFPAGGRGGMQGGRPPGMGGQPGQGGPPNRGGPPGKDGRPGMGGQQGMGRPQGMDGRPGGPPGMGMGAGGGTTGPGLPTGGLFRAPRYTSDYPGLKGKDLKPKGSLGGTVGGALSR